VASRVLPSGVGPGDGSPLPLLRHLLPDLHASGADPLDRPRRSLTSGVDLLRFGLLGVHEIPVAASAAMQAALTALALFVVLAPFDRGVRRCGGTARGASDSPANRR
jgi:hypothetical protein